MSKANVVETLSFGDSVQISVGEQKLSKPASPYPVGYTPAMLLVLGAPVPIMTIEAETQFNLAWDCNSGQINGSFTQDQFNQIWAATNSAPWSTAILQWAKDWAAIGVGTKRGAAGTYLNE